MRIMLVALILVATTMLQPFRLPAEPRLAQVYLVRALELYHRGELGRALDVTEKSLLYQKNSSDALYLKSLLLGEGAEVRRESLDAVLAALEAGSWERFQEREGIFRAAELYYLCGSYSEALKLLENQGPGDAEADHLVLLNLKALGGGPELDEKLKRALESYPRDPRFLRIAFLVKDPLDPEVSALFLYLDREDPAYLPAFSAYLRKIASPQELVPLAEEYFARGGEDPAVSWAIIEALPETRTREIERFFALDGFLRMDLLRRANELEDQEFRQDFSHRFSQVGGEAFWDPQEKGQGEEGFFFEEGRLRVWTIHKTDEERKNLRLQFSRDGLPQEWMFWDGRTRIFCTYHVYPYVKRMDFTQEGKNSRRFFGPQSFLAPILASLPAPEDFLELASHPYQIDLPLIRGLVEDSARVAYRIEEREEGASQWRRFSLREGSPYLLEFLLDSSQGEQLFRRVVFYQGLPQWGERDIDRDGDFETREIFEDGILRALELRREGYRETYLPQAYKEWDFNGDGRVDAREYQLGGGRVRREYASAFDGVFDSTAEDLMPGWPEP